MKNTFLKPNPQRVESVTDFHNNAWWRKQKVSLVIQQHPLLEGDWSAGASGVFHSSSLSLRKPLRRCFILAVLLCCDSDIKSSLCFALSLIHLWMCEDVWNADLVFAPGWLAPRKSPEGKPDYTSLQSDPDAPTRTQEQEPRHWALQARCFLYVWVLAESVDIKSHSRRFRFVLKVRTASHDL